MSTNSTTIHYESTRSIIQKVSPKPTTTNRRNRSNHKERRRNFAINDAFVRLQHRMPYIPADQRLPKIKTLRLALKYIDLLGKILGDTDANGSASVAMTRSYFGPPRPLEIDDFAPIVAAEIQSRNSYKQRAEQMLDEDEVVEEDYGRCADGYYDNGGQQQMQSYCGH